MPAFDISAGGGPGGGAPRSPAGRAGLEERALPGGGGGFGLLFLGGVGPRDFGFAFVVVFFVFFFML